jgi:hypothetical protein
VENRDNANSFTAVVVLLPFLLTLFYWIGYGAGSNQKKVQAAPSLTSFTKAAHVCYGNDKDVQYTTTDTCLDGTTVVEKVEDRPLVPGLKMYIRKDDDLIRSGVILTAECEQGFPPYSYLHVPYGDIHYYSHITVFLNQHCIVGENWGTPITNNLTK